MWETINWTKDSITGLIVENTMRLKVFGGWIVKTTGSNGTALVFVSDYRHIWKLEEKKK